jgi:hypothetical protein
MLNADARLGMAWLVSGTFIVLVVLLLSGFPVHQGRDTAAVDLIKLLAAISGAAFGGYGLGVRRARASSEEKGGTPLRYGARLVVLPRPDPHRVRLNGSNTRSAQSGHRRGKGLRTRGGKAPRGDETAAESRCAWSACASLSGAGRLFCSASAQVHWRARGSVRDEPAPGKRIG